MMKKKILGIFVLLLCMLAIQAQETFPTNGISDKRPNKYALINAQVHVSPSIVMEKGILLVEGKTIKKVGLTTSIPSDYVTIDMAGKHIYAAFIDSYSNYGMPELKKPRSFNYYNTVFDSDKKGAYSWNQAVKAEVNASEVFVVDEKMAKTMRESGFATAWTHTKDGIVRGTGSVVFTGTGKEQENIAAQNISKHFSFDKGTSGQSYPISLMGSVALLRQTYLDADWYAKGGNKVETNLSLAAFNNSRSLLPVFESTDILDILRADNVGDEFKEQFIFKGNGDEYQKISLLKNTNAKLILPINFPEAMDVNDMLEAKKIPLAKLKHWDLAPTNPSKLQSAGIDFVITPDGNYKSFFDNLRKAVEYGWSKENALASITTKPAALLGMDGKLGTISDNAIANFYITDKEIFDKDFQAYETWVNGERFMIKDISAPVLASNYEVSTAEGVFSVKPKLDKGNYSFSLFKNDSVKVNGNASFKGENLIINLPLQDSLKMTQLTGFLMKDGSFKGVGVHPNSQSFNWEAVAKEDSKPEGKKAADKKEEAPKVLSSVTFPFNSYGNSELPKAQNYLFKNATVWTNESQGIVEDMDVMVSNGKIQNVGKNLSAGSGYQTVDATGKHLTSGIIDEHSHIALFSINEIQTVSSHVRQNDVIDSEDIDIYRQLAGGVTTSQLLHGSADCIGGQSAIIKLKWGESPEGLKFKGADQFIKFALGENVKRGNSPNSPNRFPSTRMGVEQVYFDAFSQAKDYKKAWAAWNVDRNKTNLIPPRRDLAMDALVDILDDRMFITCHSYVQSEINMLMHVADSMDFNVNTFTHILEGYKVADKMKDRKIYGSTFSDWWAYKMEVKEAIPYNAAIMTKAGVTTAINSDDAEMARRLNQEAAKTMLYGGLSQEEAWKTVTLNPAKMLHIDKKVGSIAVGKDADLVLWNNNPLSVYAKPDMTMIDGAVYFEAKDYEKKTAINSQEKIDLIQAMMKSKGPKQKMGMDKPSKSEMHLHCDSIVEFDNLDIATWEANYLKY